MADDEEEKLGRAKAPFDLTSAAHIVARVAEAMNWNFADAEVFLRKVQHVEYGLSAEIEFAAILRWLGVCKLVHRLSEDKLADPSFSELEIPDLFATFESAGTCANALIEVKTSEGMELKFTRRYLSRLEAYAKQMSLPLLIACRPREVGFWILFDPGVIEWDGDNATVKLTEIVKNDLMGVLAGDFSLVPMEGAGMRIVAKRVSEKEPTENGYQATFEVAEATFHDADGNATPALSHALSSLIVATLKHEEKIEDDYITQSFTASDGMTKAQMVLRTAVGFPLREDERIHWRAVSNRLESILKASELLAEAQMAFGSFVRYVFFQQPQKIPAFLAQGWKPPHSAKEG